MRFPLLPIVSLLLLACQPDGIVRKGESKVSVETKEVKITPLLKKKSYVKDLFLESARRSLFGFPDAIRMHTSDETYTKLLELLDGDVVHLSLEPLKDNRGNPVAALGEPGKITLYVGSEGDEELGWERLMTRGQVFEQIVFHELLRAVDVDDDDYKITRKILPYTLSFKLSQSQMPVTADDIVREGFQFSHPTLDGSIPEVRTYTLSLPTSPVCERAWCQVLVERTGESIHTYPNPGEDSIQYSGTLSCRATVSKDKSRTECTFMISEPSNT